LVHHFKLLPFCLSFLILSHLSVAAVFPKEGSKLNYRLIGFSLPYDSENGKYKIEIAIGYYNNIDSFKKNIVVTTTSEKNKLITEVPSFGKKYTWRAVNATNGRTEQESQLYHFSTGFIPVVDTSMFRLKIVKQAEKFKDDYVFVDALGTLFDMKGNPVWYLPGVKYEPNTTIQPRDIKVSSFGTITYLINSFICEINYNGDTLWSNNGHNTKDHEFGFHHQFNRLHNGHYMALASEDVVCSVNNKKITSGNLVEFDEKGNIVWMWKVLDYILNSDLRNYVTSFNGVFDFHDNAFYFDQKKQVVYISLKNVNRVVKIKYPEGNVLTFYGNKFNKTDMGKDFAFHCQHAVKHSDDGNLYLFDNGCNISTDPKLLLLHEPIDDKDSIKVEWEFQCPVTEIAGGSKMGENPGGGNVKLLPDKSMFVSTGLRSGAMFIVSLDKNILWSAVPQVWNKAAKRWDMILSYKSYMLSDQKRLEQLIWNAEK